MRLLFFDRDREGEEKPAWDERAREGSVLGVCSRYAIPFECAESRERFVRQEGEREIWSSEQGSTEDALELSGEEGRGKLRKAAGRSKHPEIRGLPNGVTRLSGAQSFMPE